WGPKKFYRSGFFDTTTSATTLRMSSGIIDPAEGKSYVQLAVMRRSQHRSQDMGAIQRLGPSVIRLSLMASAGTADRGPVTGSPRQEAGLFEGIDTSLAPGLERYGALVDSARAAIGPRSLPRVADFLLRALVELRRNGPADFRRAKEPLLQDAILSAAGIVVDPASDDGLIVPG